MCSPSAPLETTPVQRDSAARVGSPVTQKPARPATLAAPRPILMKSRPGNCRAAEFRLSERKRNIFKREERSVNHKATSPSREFPVGDHTSGGGDRAHPRSQIGGNVVECAGVHGRIVGDEVSDGSSGGGETHLCLSTQSRHRRMDEQSFVATPASGKQLLLEAVPLDRSFRRGSSQPRRRIRPLSSTGRRCWRPPGSCTPESPPG